jgi:hypothetical protein
MADSRAQDTRLDEFAAAADEALGAAFGPPVEFDDGTAVYGGRVAVSLEHGGNPDDGCVRCTVDACHADRGACMPILMRLASEAGLRLVDAPPDGSVRTISLPGEASDIAWSVFNLPGSLLTRGQRWMSGDERQGRTAMMLAAALALSPLVGGCLAAAKSSLLRAPCDSPLLHAVRTLAWLAAAVTALLAWGAVWSLSVQQERTEVDEGGCADIGPHFRPVPRYDPAFDEDVVDPLGTAVLSLAVAVAVALLG